MRRSPRSSRCIGLGPAATNARDTPTIAEEESGHAELSRALDDWLRTQLDEAAQVRVDAALRAACAELCDEVRAARFDRFTEIGGPSNAEAIRIVRRARSVRSGISAGGFSHYMLDRDRCRRGVT